MMNTWFIAVSPYFVNQVEPSDTSSHEGRLVKVGHQRRGDLTTLRGQAGRSRGELGGSDALLLSSKAQ